MAVRRPLVLDAGVIKELPAGDTVGTSAGELAPMPNLEVVKATIAGMTTSVTQPIAGDQIGNELTFAACAAAGKGAIINDAAYEGETVGVFPGSVDLYLFDRASNPAGNNNPNSWADADMANLLGILTFEKPIASALNEVARCVAGLPLTVKGNASVNIFGVLVTRVTHTVFPASATGLVLKLGVAQAT